MLSALVNAETYNLPFVFTQNDKALLEIKTRLAPASHIAKLLSEMSLAKEGVCSVVQILKHQFNGLVRWIHTTATKEYHTSHKKVRPAGYKLQLSKENQSNII